MIPYSDKLGFVSHLSEHFGCNVNSVGWRVVVNHDGQICRFRSSPKVSDCFPFVGLVDHCRQDRQTVNARILSSLGIATSKSRRVFSNSCQDWDSFVDMRDDGFEEFNLLMELNRAIFPDCPQHHEPANACFKQNINVPNRGIKSSEKSSRNWVGTAGKTPRQLTSIMLFPPFRQPHANSAMLSVGILAGPQLECVLGR